MDARASAGCVLLSIVAGGLLSGCPAPGATATEPRRPVKPATPGNAARAGDDVCRRPDPIFGPTLVPAAIYAARTGADAHKFSELGVSTKERPLEECGLKRVLVRLVTLTCDDGSNPFSRDLKAAHMSRSGNVGPGGRCDSIIDRYEVACPERTYAVFADMYICPRPLDGDGASK